MDDEIQTWLALSRRPWPGRGAVSALQSGRLSARALLEGGSRGPTDWSAVEEDLRWLEGPDHHLLPLPSPDYPERLRQIPDPPLVLFVRGRPAALSLAQMAMVGSRRATPTGRDTAFALARDLVASGIAVTSGLATGIDAASHRGALAGGGTTVAVAAHGLDRVYPRHHRALAEEVLGRGAMISEFAPGMPPLSGNFPRRNRIISGLSLGVLVVEAAERSGSLITARLAGEQGRDVFAVPGSIHNPLSRGCHRLIREGAKLVETVTDVLEELPGVATRGRGAMVDGDTRPPRSEHPAEHARVLHAIGYDATVFDSIVQRSGLTAQAVSSILLALELEGAVESIPGGAYLRAVQRR